MPNPVITEHFILSEHLLGDMEKSYKTRCFHFITLQMFLFMCFMYLFYVFILFICVLFITDVFISITYKVINDLIVKVGDLCLMNIFLST